MQKKERTYQGGEELILMGERHYLLLIRDDSTTNKISVDQGRIIMQYNSDNPDGIRALLVRWYRETARQIIEKRLHYYQDKLGVKYNDFRIREQKTRWGSCSSKGNLNFNWKLIMAPLSIIDYVVVHELAHLKHMNHSKAFWSVIESQVSDYKARRKWLKQNGNKLGL